MRYFIYQRISTEKQELLRQENAIAEYCKANNIVVDSENIYSDIITGKTFKRENYQKMKSALEKDDVLIMLDLDRLGRNWDLIKNEWQDLTRKGVYIIVVNCPLINVLPDTNGSVSLDRRLIQEMMFTLLCYVSQKEVEKISLRTKEALQAKKASGVRLGKPQVYDSEIIEKARSLHEQGLTVRKIAETLGISKTTAARFIKKDN